MMLGILKVRKSTAAAVNSMIIKADKKIVSWKGFMLESLYCIGALALVYDKKIGNIDLYVRGDNF
jgi:hypothetical protein